MAILAVVALGTVLVSLKDSSDLAMASGLSPGLQAAQPAEMLISSQEGSTNRLSKPGDILSSRATGS